jgi:hypothetical protein
MFAFAVAVSICLVALLLALALSFCGALFAFPSSLHAGFRPFCVVLVFSTIPFCSCYSTKGFRSN